MTIYKGEIYKKTSLFIYHKNLRWVVPKIESPKRNDWTDNNGQPLSIQDLLQPKFQKGRRSSILQRHLNNLIRHLGLCGHNNLWLWFGFGPLFDIVTVSDSITESTDTRIMKSMVYNTIISPENCYKNFSVIFRPLKCLLGRRIRFISEDESEFSRKIKISFTMAWKFDFFRRSWVLSQRDMIHRVQ